MTVVRTQNSRPRRSHRQLLCRDETARGSPCSLTHLTSRGNTSTATNGGGAPAGSGGAGGGDGGSAPRSADRCGIGLLPERAIETLMLYIVSAFHSTLETPLDCLLKFLAFYSRLDWGSYGMSIGGPVRLRNAAVVSPCRPSDLLLDRGFVSSYSRRSHAGEATASAAATARAVPAGTGCPAVTAARLPAAAVANAAGR